MSQGERAYLSEWKESCLWVGGWEEEVYAGGSPTLDYKPPGRALNGVGGVNCHKRLDGGYLGVNQKCAIFGRLGASHGIPAEGTARQ